MQDTSLRTTVLLVALIAALAMTAVAPEAGNILYLTAAAISLAFLRPTDRQSFARPIVWMPLAGMAILAVTYAIGSGSLNGAGGIVFFAPIFTIAPLIILAGKTEAPKTNLIAVLCLCGAAGAAAVAVGEFLTAGVARAGDTVANPIHFADVALAAGFLSLIGMVSSPGWSRLVFLLAPALAGVAVLLSGTRGAVIALALMAVLAIVLAGALRLIALRTLAIGMVAGIAIAIVALVAGVAQTSGMQRIMTDIAEVLQFGMPTDGSTTLRLGFYQGGFRAFLAAPIFGQGPFHYVEAASGLSDVPFPGVPHLHSDVADFAASGGILGLVAYLLLLLAPLVEAIRSRATPISKGVIVVTSVLVLGYFVMGLTNAVFGILTLTVFYAAICVVVGLFTEPVSA